MLHGSRECGPLTVDTAVSFTEAPPGREVTLDTALEITLQCGEFTLDTALESGTILWMMIDSRTLDSTQNDVPKLLVILP